MTLRGGRQVLDPETVLQAYCSGYFPMADSGTGDIRWYSPDPRAIIPLSTFKVSRSLHRFIRKRNFEVRVDTVFRDVINGCARRESTWISEEIAETYCVLHSMGYAHSVESWLDDRLVGGLYGVAIGGAFFGESMFSVLSNGSNVALVHLVEILRVKQFKLLDTQFITDHLKRFGAIELSRGKYLEMLSEALRVVTTFH